jgi:hypothetical protein
MKRIVILLSVLILSSIYLAPPVSAKERVFLLTDIGNEPDDQMSLVRFLVYANQWDVEGLVATTSTHQKGKIFTTRIRELVDAYGLVRDNLDLHEKGFPTADALHAVVAEGPALYGMLGVGKGHDSSGSELLITAVDRADSRPLWVPVWGGPNVLAQALWKVRETRSKKQLQAFVSRLRVYTISDQDDSGPWLRKNFPDLFYIASPGFHGGGAYHQATWSGIGGDRFHGRFGGADFFVVDNPWLDAQIRSKGPLGAHYPQLEFMMEGDTPSFLNLIENGLSVPEHPEWGGWGGRYEYYTPRMRKWFLEPETRPFWSDAEDEVLGNDGQWHTTNEATIWRWRQPMQNDFVARMDWTIKPFAQANHPPVPVLGHAAELSAKPGDRVTLKADATDPDGNTVAYQWFYYPEAGTFSVQNGRTGAPVSIENAQSAEASFTVPKNGFKMGTMHFIVAVTDHGTPRLTRYKRVIVSVDR